MARSLLSTEFLNYLAECANAGPGCERLPSLNDLAKELGISVASLREQVEVAKALGLIEVRPRTGIRRQPYSFYPAIRQSLAYAIETDSNHFTLFADLRNHVEAAYWDQAVRVLTPEDIAELKLLVEQAWEKLRGPHIQIPHAEHRRLHLTIFRRLNNPFVLGILEAYWEAYEAVGLSMFADYDYLQKVWSYHQAMVDALCQGDYSAGYRALVEHKDLIHYRSGAAAVAPSHTSLEEVTEKRPVSR